MFNQFFTDPGWMKLLETLQNQRYCNFAEVDRLRDEDMNLCGRNKHQGQLQRNNNN